MKTEEESLASASLGLVGQPFSADPNRIITEIVGFHYLPGIGGTVDPEELRLAVLVETKDRGTP
jgi:hypothetical protein